MEGDEIDGKFVWNYTNNKTNVQEEIINQLISKIEDPQEQVYWKGIAKKCTTKEEALYLIQILKRRVNKIPPIEEFIKLANKYGIKFEDYLIDPYMAKGKIHISAHFWADKEEED
jgi:hypothetical protein